MPLTPDPLPVQDDRKLVLRQAMQAIDALQAKLDRAEHARREPIAIVGMACRYPGAASIEEYWTLLDEGREAITPVPKDRWDAQEFTKPDPSAPEPIPAAFGGFLDNVSDFDAAFFGISAREAETMDPQQRLALETAWRALENAGIAPDRLRGSQTGVFMGVTTSDYARLSAARHISALDVYTATGSALNVVAGRISYALGLNGPAAAIDTACSSSLVALHLGCQSLRNGETSMVLAGGVNVLLTPEPFICFAKWGMMAPDGRCKTFDARADGFVRSEGCGIVVLKRLSDAIAAGDRVLAVIRGTAVNQDGASSGLTVPNGPAQEAVVRTALASAGLRPQDIDYIEAHGTGTSLGDPIELEALAAVLGAGRDASLPLRIGSVKTNIGHAESASGVAGLIKVVLALQREKIPAHLNFQKLNPRITLGGAPIEITARPTPWRRSERVRRAGVSSFGFSGTNAHAILEEAPTAVPPRTIEPAPPPHLLVFSARTEHALRQLAQSFGTRLESLAPEQVAAFCQTAAIGRSALHHRAAVVIQETAATAKSLSRLSAGGSATEIVTGTVQGEPKLAFLFTGQGSQYAGMGRELHAREPVFRQAFDRCAEILNKRLDHPLDRVIGLSGDAYPGLISETRYTQPALFALEYALSELWRSWGIVPAAVAGHSLGELVAACVAGVLTLEDSLDLVAERARLMQELPRGGAMAAVLAEADRVAAAVQAHGGDVAIAAINAPANVVISGAEPRVRELCDSFRAQGVDVRPLDVSHAFHSPLLEPMLGALERHASRLAHHPAVLEFALNATGTMLEDGAALDPGYWRTQARGTVRFAACIQSLHARGITHFLEVGPAPVLIGLGRQVLEKSDARWLASMRKDSPARAQMLASLGALWTSGFAVEWQNVLGPAAPRQDVPVYPFQRRRHWLPATPARPVPPSATVSTPAGAHPFLGDPIRSPVRQLQVPCLVHPDQHPVIGEHRIAGTAIFPASGYIELAHAAGQVIFPNTPVRIEGVALRAALRFDGPSASEVLLVSTPRSAEHVDFEVFSRNTGGPSPEEWTSHAGGSLVPANGASFLNATMSEAESRCTGAVDIAAYQAEITRVGLEYGPSFRALVSARRGDGEAFGTLRLPENDALHHNVSAHLGIVDAAFHLIGLALDQLQQGSFLLPMGFDSAQVLAPVGPEAKGHVRIRERASDRVIADITLWNAAGETAVEVQGLHVRPITSSHFRRLLGLDAVRGLERMAWTSAPALPAEPPIAARWKVIGGTPAQRADLAKSAGAFHQRIEPLAAGEEIEWIDHVHASVPADVAGIIDLRPLDTPDLPGTLSSASPATLAEHGAAGAILDLFRLLAAKPPARKLRVVLPTLRAQGVASDDATNPLAAVVWGMSSAAASELSNVDIRLVDVDSPDRIGAAAMTAAVRPDSENRLAVRGEQCLAARLVPLNAAEPGRPEVPQGPYELFMRNRGNLSGLGIQSANRRSPGPGEVEIEVLASGLNFRDVLNLLDMYPGPAGALGNECCGRVVALGPGVTGLEAGDLVMCIAENTFASHVVAQASMVFPVPASLSVAQAAVFPIAQLTAYLALHDVGKIKRGDRVLVHAGAGGVGLAAVHLALAAGAEVLATAGSEGKRALLRSLGVSHVFDSRTPLRAARVMEATGGRGVDLLLNSLTGEFIEEGLKSLAANGHFLEIGLRELRTPEQVKSVRPDVHYHALLLGETCRAEPVRVRRMHEALMAMLQAGSIPGPAVRVHAIADAEGAFRFMAKARHVGRIALAHGTAAEMRVRPDASYLVTGGLGALGLHVAGWLVERGARDIVLMGRREPSPAAAERIRGWTTQGVAVTWLRGDVADEKVLAQLKAAGRPPLRGVVHAAGVTEDAVLGRTDSARLRRVLAPKIDGVAQLAALVEPGDLDFFVLFSSGASLLGNTGQVAYAGANAFLDAFAHRMQGLGARCVSINWGAWKDGGMASSLGDATLRGWAERGIGLLPTAVALNGLESAIGSGRPQVAMLAIDWPKFLGSIPAQQRPPLLADLAEGESFSQAGRSAPEKPLHERLAEVPVAERTAFIASLVQAAVASVLGVSDPGEIELEASLTEQGMDSLMAMELRNRLESETSFIVPVNRLLGSSTPLDLARFIESLLAAAAPAQAAPSPSAASTEGEI